MDLSFPIVRLFSGHSKNGLLSEALSSTKLHHRKIRYIKIPRYPLKPSCCLTIQLVANYHYTPPYRIIIEGMATFLTSLNLRENGIPRGPTEEELPELQRLFPTLRNVSYEHPLLILVVEDLPKKPWPMVFANLPLWLTTTENSRPPIDIGLMARAAQRFNVKSDIKYYETPNEGTVLEIFKLVNEKGAGVDRIRWIGCGFHAFGNHQPGEGWQNCLPSRINGFAISYTWTKSTMTEDASQKNVPTKPRGPEPGAKPLHRLRSPETL
jgi:hypothetical protein